MTRRLVVLRHAKADNPPGVSDEDRPLSARGHADAQAAGAWLASRHLPDLVLCSPSKRTRQTWQAVATHRAAAAAEVRYERDIYEGTDAELLELVRGVDDSVSTVLLIGHNPTLTQLAFRLDPTGRLDSDGLRTCGMSVHLVEGSWSDLGPGRVRLDTVHTARGD